MGDRSILLLRTEATERWQGVDDTWDNWGGHRGVALSDLWNKLSPIWFLQQRKTFLEDIDLLKEVSAEGQGIISLPTDAVPTDLAK